MNLTIKSRIANREFTFYVSIGGEYIWLKSENGVFTGISGQPKQICRGGHFTGSTLTATSEKDFIHKCHNWYRQHMKNYYSNKNYA